MDGGAWWAAVHGVAEGRTRLSDFPFTFHFPALEKEMATHSTVLAWRIPGTAEPGGCRLWGCTELEMTEATEQQQQHHYNPFKKFFITPKGNTESFSCDPFIPNIPSSPWKLLIYFLSIDLPTLNFHRNGIIQPVVFCVWVPSFSIFSRFGHIVTCISTSFLFMAK